MLLEDYYDQMVMHRELNIQRLTYSIDRTAISAQVIPLSQIRDPQGTLAETDLELVKTVLENTAYYRKYDFNSSYPFHRPVPSVRAFNTVDVSVLICRDGEWTFGRYNPYLNRLEQCRELTPDEREALRDLVRDGHVYFLFTATFQALAAIYGEFAFQLSLIDTGHLIGQASLILQTMRATGAAERYGARLRPWEDSGLFDVRENLLAFLSVEAHGLLREAFRGDVQQCSIALPDRNLFLDFKHSVPLRATPSDAASPFPLPRLTGDAEFALGSATVVADAIMSRSSTHNQLGSSSLSVADAETSLADMFATFEFGSLGGIVDIFVLENTGSEFSLHGYDAETRSLRPLGPTLSYADIGAISSQRRSLLSLDSFVGIVFLAVPSVAALGDSHGAGGIEEAFIHCGIVGQYVCIQAARQGLFVRPIKGTDEVVINGLIGEDLLYTLLIGDANVDAVYAAVP